MRELLSDHGSWYLMVMGLAAVIVMIKWPKGIWGFVQQRFDLSAKPKKIR